MACRKVSTTGSCLEHTSQHLYWEANRPYTTTTPLHETEGHLFPDLTTSQGRDGCAARRYPLHAFYTGLNPSTRNLLVPLRCPLSFVAYESLSRRELTHSGPILKVSQDWQRSTSAYTSIVRLTRYSIVQVLLTKH